MSRRTIYLTGGVAAMWLATATPAMAQGACIFDWAVPGAYDISGNFRGQVETVVARLTNDCRVAISLPGIYTGGTLKRDGSCLTFNFKVEGKQATFKARWCGSYGVVPWEGRNIRATIKQHQGRSNTGTR